MSRLVNLFFLNRAVEPSAHPPLFAGRRANRIAFAAQIVVGVWLLGMNAYASRVFWYQFGRGRPLSPLYGIWDVEQQSVDGQLRPPLLTDSGRWRRVIFDFATGVTLQRIDDSITYYGASIDAKNKTLVVTRNQDKNWKANFTFERPAPDQMSLDGNMDGHVVRMQLKRIDPNQFLLVSRGFHWIQEYPFNR